MKWLSVKDAAQVLGKSESAAKRLIYKLQKTKPDAVKFEKNKYFVLSSELVKTDRPANDHSERTNDHSERTDDHSERPANDNFINVLVAQLAEKDEQIKRLQIDGDQKNKLIAHLQSQLQLPAPANDRTDERPTSERPANDRTDGFRLFMIFGILVILILLISVFVSL